MLYVTFLEQFNLSLSLLFTGREKPNSIFKHMATNGKMCYIISIENVLLFLFFIIRTKQYCYSVEIH